MCSLHCIEAIRQLEQIKAHQVSQHRKPSTITFTSDHSEAPEICHPSSATVRAQVTINKQSGLTDWLVMPPDRAEVGDGPSGSRSALADANFHASLQALLMSGLRSAPPYEPPSHAQSRAPRARLRAAPTSSPRRHRKRLRLPSPSAADGVEA